MRVAVLSFAHERAATYVRLLRDRPGVELVAADPDAPPSQPGRGRRTAERLGVPTYADSWDELFAHRPHAVVVASEPARRRELVERAAQARAHVLCEQPVATSEDDAQAMIDACARHGVDLAVAAPLRQSPAYAAVRRGLADGELGTLLTAHGVHNTGNPVPECAWAADPAPAGGGAVAANATCLLDLVDGLLDGEPAEQVYAQANTLLGSPSEVETAALVSVRYPSGLVVAIDCSWSRPAAQPEQDGPTMTFVGDRAVVDFNAHPRMLGGFDLVQSRARWETSTADLNAAMLDDFLAAVEGGRPSEPNGSAGLRTLRVLLAAHRSLSTNQPVELVASP